MLPKYHIFLGFFFIIFLYFLFPQISLIGLLIIFFSSFLIDVDHYLEYVFRKKDFSLIHAYNFHKKRLNKFLCLSKKQRKKCHNGVYFFHGIEWLIILFLLGYYLNNFFIFVLIGFSFHLIIDIMHEIYLKGTIDKISVLWSYYKYKKLFV